ncbi:STE like transcription factor-domain-containing protein [Globomyces pollinis-pini]|nr:STE like transcription factor-domain-containing protein [Globomyces pollinis-pini]KAJ2998433.1 homeodomain transcription factor ste12 [Globomyces sp. JEL0801]
MDNQNDLLFANQHHEEFKLFLSTAPVNWNQNESIRRFTLPNGESVSCILWNELFHITGTDIVRALIYRFECLGRSIVLQKKFEEGIFSDLRNLKPMADSTLEESRSPFLKFLYENQCIRTQKKQKVFYWYSVKHDKLFLDALERDLKREASGQPPCTVAKKPLMMNQAMEQARLHCLPSIATAPPPRNHSPVQMSMQNNMNMTNSPQHDNLLLHHPASQIGSPSMHPSLMNSPSMHPAMMGSPSQNSLMYPSPQHSLGNSPETRHGSFTPHHNSPSMSNMHSNMMHNSPSMGSHSPQLSYMNPNNMQGNYGLNLPSMFNPEYNHEQNGNHQNQKPMFFRNFEPVQPGLEPNRPAPYHLNRGRDGRRLSGGSGNEKQTCPIQGCGRTFKRLEHLRRHVRSHSGEKPYICVVADCHRSFARSDHLTQHMRTHNDNYSGVGWQNMDEQHQNGVQSMIPSHDYDLQHQFDSQNFKMEQYDNPTKLEEPYPEQQRPNGDGKESEFSGSGLNEHMDSLMGDILTLDPEMKPFSSIDQPSLLSSY